MLLLLSALLSALTGAGVGARLPQVAVTVSRSAEVLRVAPVKAVRVAGVPVAVLPTLDLAPVAVVPTWWLAPAEPLYQSRRRE